MDKYKSISIDIESRIPKYQQIVNSIISNISNGTLEIDQKLPSINNLSEEFYLSRDTVEKAYSILKDRKIIRSIRGKGSYISRTKLISFHKEIALYLGFARRLIQVFCCLQPAKMLNQIDWEDALYLLLF